MLHKLFKDIEKQKSAPVDVNNSFMMIFEIFKAIKLMNCASFYRKSQ